VNALVQSRFNEELVAIEETETIEAEDRLRRVVTSKSSYLGRKVIVACGLLHYPRRLAVLDQLDSKNVHYKSPAIRDYEGKRVAVVGGGDSALDAALMVLGRGGRVDLIVRETVPIGKADTLARVKDSGGAIHTSTEVGEAEFAGDEIRLTLTDGQQYDCSLVIAQIGFLSAKETFERLGVKLNRGWQHLH
jgi:thioredoxin reductase